VIESDIQQIFIEDHQAAVQSTTETRLLQHQQQLKYVLSALEQDRSEVTLISEEYNSLRDMIADIKNGSRAYAVVEGVILIVIVSCKGLQNHFAKTPSNANNYGNSDVVILSKKYSKYVHLRNGNAD